MKQEPIPEIPSETLEIILDGISNIRTRTLHAKKVEKTLEGKLALIKMADQLLETQRKLRLLIFDVEDLGKIPVPFCPKCEGIDPDGHDFA
tara:strand:+ start:919 stop:1191 length:273 start_codon:yes stop_codon:yes gene_type:complete